MNQFVRLVLFLLSIPFRLQCGKVGKSVWIAPGYSFFSCHLRNVFIEDKVQIGSRAWIQTVPIEKAPKPKIVIGEGTSIGRNATLSAASKITIGRNCLISYGVSFLDHDHAFRDVERPPLVQGLTTPKAIEIGEDCFIGAHSFILKGVTLGRHCVVGANSVVTSSFPDFSLVAGVPAVKIKDLNSKD